MRKVYRFILFLFMTTNAYAGIETELFLQEYNHCLIRITHDATPDSDTGVILFRAYKIVEGMHQTCSPEVVEVTDSLKQALVVFREKSELKKITSVMIGRLVDYKWMSDALEAKSKKQTGKTKQLNHQQFNQFIQSSDLTQPFKEALAISDYRIKGISCEKLMFYRNGAPKDGLCWLIVSKSKQ